LALFGTKSHRLGSALRCILVSAFYVVIIWHLDPFIRKGCVNKSLHYDKAYQIKAQCGFQGGQVKGQQVAGMQVASKDFACKLAVICHLRPATCHVLVANSSSP